SPSRSQAGFCPCTRRTISNRAEPTLGRLRYALGGDRPSQTAPLPRSPGRLHGPRLEPSHSQGGISTAPPSKLALRVPRLPPILHRLRQSSMTGYSQGSRGLSVYSREASIFTGATVSPGLSRRQRPSRYAIRAGRNLPDKEFRYLRTVIVTAAVYRGFGSELRLAAAPSPYPSGTGQASDPIPPLARWQSPVFLVNSRLALFTATPSGSSPYRGTPSPEVTGSFCLVPSREFSRAPEASRL